MLKTEQYKACDHIKKTKPTTEANADVVKAIGTNFKLLPLFETGVFEFNYKLHKSMTTNELLKCRWSIFKGLERKHEPFGFLDRRDYHFFNGDIKLLPEQSIHKNVDFRFKLKLGPGVDYRGQIPIPQDMIMKRGKAKPKPKKEEKKVIRTESEENAEKEKKKNWLKKRNG